MAKTFLLIDDDSDDRMLFSEAAEAIGRGVIPITSESGVTTIERMKNQLMRLPDVIFLDVNIPGKDGWYCLNLLKQDERLKGIPVIMYSTSSNKRDIEKAAENGALFLFTKPNLFEDLQNCIGIILMHMENNTLGSIDNFNCKWFHYRAGVNTAL